MSRTNDYIGREFISKDGYKCTIIRQLTFDKRASQCRYKVEFEDGTVLEFSYKTLRQGDFNKIKAKNLEVGSTVCSKDGYKGKILEIASSDQYKVQFDDGEVRTYSGGTLKTCDFIKERKFPYFSFETIIGQKFKGRDDCVCTVQEIAEKGDNLRKSKLLVEFDSGCKKIFNYRTLINHNFTDNFDVTIDYSNKKFISSDGYTCKIVERLTFDDIFSNCCFKVVYDDGTEAVYKYLALYNGNFSKSRKVSLIGKKFTGRDGNSCVVEKALGLGTSKSSMLYLVRFEDGHTREFTYRTLITGNFVKYSKIRFNVGAKDLSIDGIRYQVIERIKHSYIVVEYEDGFKDIVHLHNIKRFRKTEFYIRIDEEVISGYYKCECLKCGLKNIMTYDEIYKHKKKHILKSI